MDDLRTDKTTKVSDNFQVKTDGLLMTGSLHACLYRLEQMVLRFGESATVSSVLPTLYKEHNDGTG